MKEERIMRKSTALLVVFLLVGGLIIIPGEPAGAHPEELICDFLTGGGWIVRPNGAKANFGVGGGCKHGEFWGHLNYLDHGNTPAPAVVPPPFHVHWMTITAYIFIDATSRDICGTATTNHPLYPVVDFHLRASDKGEPGRDDTFAIRLGVSGSVIYTTEFDSDKTLGGPGPGGGNIQLHKPNPSTTGSFGGTCNI
jgi:hypothetical protein